MQRRLGSLKRLIELTNLWLNSERKKEKLQINKMRSKREVTMDITETQRQYKKLSTTKFDNLKELDKFLEICTLFRLKNWKI